MVVVSWCTESRVTVNERLPTIFFIRPVYGREDITTQENSCMEGARVLPSNLNEYIRHHELKAPCCLCALMDDVPYTEGKIRLLGAEGGNMASTYIVECAQSRCGYYGEH